MIIDPHPPNERRPFTLIGADGNPHPSTIPGTLGGHRRTKIFGQLDCPTALRAIARSGYVDHRVFFPDADTAQLAGYRSCATCKPDAYREWKTNINVHSQSRSQPELNLALVTTGLRARFRPTPAAPPTSQTRSIRRSMLSSTVATIVERRR